MWWLGHISNTTNFLHPARIRRNQANSFQADRSTVLEKAQRVYQEVMSRANIESVRLQARLNLQIVRSTVEQYRVEKWIWFREKLEVWLIPDWAGLVMEFLETPACMCPYCLRTDEDIDAIVQGEIEMRCERTGKSFMDEEEDEDAALAAEGFQ